MSFMDLPPKTVVERELANPASPSRVSLSATISTATAPKLDKTEAAISYGALGSAAQLSQRIDEIRRGKGGVIGTSGKPAIALRIDHQLDPFIAKVQPLLKARSIPYAIGLVSRSVGNPAAAYEPTTATWADVRNLVMNEGGEIWCHSATHSDGTSFYDEIVTSKAEIESHGIRVMGWQQPGAPATYSHQSINAMDNEAGRLIRANYGLFETYIPGTVYRTLPTNGAWGHDHRTIDALTLASAQSDLDKAIQYGFGLEFMLHPLNLDLAGYMTTATLTSFLDYLVTKRDAGLIEILTPSGLAFADPGSSRRFQLAPYGTFEGVATSPIPTPWAESGAAWTIGTDGGHGGANYLRVPASQSLATCRTAVGNLGMDGFTFMFDGWCRATETGGATWRVNIANRGAVNTTIVNKTGVLTQGTSWTRVRFPFTVPIQYPSDLTIGIGRLSGASSVDWDDVSVVPV